MDNRQRKIWLAGGAKSVPSSIFLPEKGKLHRSGKYLLTEDNQVWFGRGLTMFMLYARYLRGEDITPQLDYARSVGVNYLRVFGPVPVPPWGEEWRFYQTHPQLASRLPDFAKVLGDHGLRFEWVPVCGPWSSTTARTMLIDSYAALANSWNVFVEWANEPGQVGTFHENLHTLGDNINRRGILSATGIAAIPDPANAQVLLGIPRVDHYWQMHWLDYGTMHLNDTQLNRYPRTSKYLKEIRDGDGGAQGSFMPEWGDEPVRVDDNDTYPGVEEHVAHNAIASLFGGAQLVHYDLGRVGLAPPAGGLCDRVIRETTKIWQFIPPIATTGTYTRGDFNEFPVYWTPTDSQVEHAYGTWVGSVGWFVNPLPQPWWKRTFKPGYQLLGEGPRPWIFKAGR